MMLYNTTKCCIAGAASDQPDAKAKSEYQQIPKEKKRIWVVWFQALSDQLKHL